MDTNTLWLALRAVADAAPRTLDAERAAQVASAVEMAEGALLRLVEARTHARLMNRAPAAVRALNRARAELASVTGEGWEPVAAPALRELVALCGRLSRAHRVATDASAQ